jgi:hypothetical protein
MIALCLALWAVLMLLYGYDHAAAITAVIAMLCAAVGKLGPSK